MSKFSAKYATTLHTDPQQAVEELKAQLGPAPEASAVLFFCSPQYPLAALGQLLDKAFAARVMGCTSSGQLGPRGFQKGGITAVLLSDPGLTVTPYLIAPLAQCQGLAAQVAARVRAARKPLPYHAFALLLVDGLSLMEERLVASLYHSLGNIPLVGGSAGDDLEFKKTYVYYEGEFYSDAAILCVFETTLPFTSFKFQHFGPSDKKMVVTSADPERRVVYEFNGEPAALAYAEAVGVPLEALNAQVFSKYPLVLRIAGEDYVRSISRVHPDNSFTLFCAIDEGVVLSLAQSLDVMGTLVSSFDALKSQGEEPGLVIGCDCILRRLEMEQRGLDKQVGAFLAQHQVIGFSTYGEQYQAVHVNQTFTGVALGRGL